MSLPLRLRLNNVDVLVIVVPGCRRDERIVIEAYEDILRERLGPDPLVAELDQLRAEYTLDAGLF